MIKRKNLNSYFKRVDFFARDIAFKEDGGSSFGSIFGACTSLLIVLIVASYGASKFLILVNYEDTRLQEFVEKKQLSDEVFDESRLQLKQLAFGILDKFSDTDAGINYFDGNHTQYIDYHIGIWSENSGVHTLDEEFTIHRCNETDKKYLGHDDTLLDLDTDFLGFWPHMYCLDNPEKLRLR